MTSFSPLLLLLSFFSLQPPPWEGILAQTALSSAAVCDFRVHLCSAIGIYREGNGAQRIFFNRQRKKIQRRTLNDHSYLRSPTLNLGTMWLVGEEKKTIGSYNSLAFFSPATSPQHNPFSNFCFVFPCSSSISLTSHLQRFQLKAGQFWSWGCTTMSSQACYLTSLPRSLAPSLPPSPSSSSSWFLPQNLNSYTHYRVWRKSFSNAFTTLPLSTPHRSPTLPLSPALSHETWQDSRTLLSKRKRSFAKSVENSSKEQRGR